MKTETIKFIPKKVKKRVPSDSFHFRKGKIGMPKRCIVDFWQWAYSDLLQNTTRGVLAEYIVAFLLNCDKEPRNPWDAYDLKLKDGRTIEIKTMSKLQAWAQSKLSDSQVVLTPTRKWDPKTGIMEKESTFNADLYIFCYFKADNHQTADPLDLSQWEFFVFTKERIKKLLDGKKSISLKKLETNGIKCVLAKDLRKALNN